MRETETEEFAGIAGPVHACKEDIYVMLLTAGISIIKTGVAFVARLALYYAIRRRIMKV